jgi:hypothetical protein
MKLWQRSNEHHRRTHTGGGVLLDWIPKKLLRNSFVHNVIALYGV